MVSDDKIVSAGHSFQDQFGASLGLSASGASSKEQQVDGTHHPETRSICSIDWTTPTEDHLLFGPGPAGLTGSFSKWNESEVTK